MNDNEFERRLATALELMTVSEAPAEVRNAALARVSSANRARESRSQLLAGAAAIVAAVAIAATNLRSPAVVPTAGSADPGASAVSGSRTQVATITPAAVAGRAWPDLRPVGTIASFRLVSPSSGWIRTDVDIRYTGDGGLTWVAHELPAEVEDARYSRLVFLDDRHVFALVVSGDGVSVARTSDGGRNWRMGGRIVDADEGRSVVLNFETPDHGWLFVGPRYPGSTADIFETTDGGETWAGPVGIDTGEGADSPRRYVMTEGTDPMLFWRNGKRDDVPFDDSFGISSDGGATWLRGHLPTPSDVPSGLLKMENGVDVLSDGTIVLGLTFDLGRSQTTGVFTTEDGKSWTRRSPQWPQPMSGHLRMFVANDRSWVVLADDGSVSFVTNDGGAHWDEIAGTTEFHYLDVISFATVADGWAVHVCHPDEPEMWPPNCSGPGATDLYVTQDSGRTWELLVGA